MRVPLLAAALVAAMVTTTLPATAVTANDDADTVRFALTKVSGPSSDRRFTAQLRCDDTTAARATLVHPKQSVQVRAHAAATRTCTVELRAEAVPGRTDEVTYTIRQDDRVLARRVAYARNGRSVSSDFIAPHGEVQVDIEVASLARDRVGVPVRAMAFNIWRSGTLDAHPDGEQNLAELIEFVRSEDPDILFMVETYGSGEKIVDGLNKGLPRERRYTGVRITREPDQTPTEDNLWLFTRFPVEKVYPRLGEGDLTSFNFGGARLRLPNGERLHAFPTWLHHTDGATNLTNQSALEEVLGLGRTYTDQQIVDTDKRRRIGMATTLLEERLPGYLAEDSRYADAPVLLGGDFNTLSHLDWSARFANAPGHAGLVLDWPVTRMFTQAGFTDTYRWANPDAGRYPGRTWSPINGFGYAPQRIDYVLARGEDVRVLSSHTRARRLPAHRGSDLDEIYPFYSDHGAVVTDLLIRGKGTGPKRPPVTDAPEPPAADWPEPPAGRPVPAAELTATATSEQSGGGAARAVDGDLRTHWHSRYSPQVDPQPHDITIDMQRERTLSAVRYQPRVVGNMNGTLLRVVVQASSDGSAWEDVTTVTWERTTLPKDVDLTGVTARYLRFHVELGIGGFSSAAEITPYEPE